MENDVIKVIETLSQQHQYIPYVMLCSHIGNISGIDDIIQNLQNAKIITVHRGLNDKLIKLQRK